MGGGDPANKILVLCEGKIIMVTQNLGDGLLRIRLKDGSRIVWADAIRINQNQNDDMEKRSQASLMETTYENATLAGMHNRRDAASLYEPGGMGLCATGHFLTESRQLSSNAVFNWE
jgi:hypothetical protein